MLKRIADLAIKLYNNEGFMYLVIGGITTVINFVVFGLGCYLLGFYFEKSIAWKIAEVIAFFTAVTFAFFADKFLVFKKNEISLKIFFIEFSSFVSLRLVSQFFTMCAMSVLIDYLGLKELLAKFISSFINIILNYLFSKFFIFKKNA